MDRIDCCCKIAGCDRAIENIFPDIDGTIGLVVRTGGHKTIYETIWLDIESSEKLLEGLRKCIKELKND